MKTETALVLLFVLLRCGKRARAAAPTGTGPWVPQPDPDGFNVPVIPLPANPLDPNTHT